jgi:DNA-binding transcriptional regulator YdaS (Cro superfamily)
MKETHHKPHINAVAKAVIEAGGQSALARMLGVRQGHIWNWLNRDANGVPPGYVLKIEAMTGVSRHELRPDIFASTTEADASGSATGGSPPPPSVEIPPE